MYKIIKYEERYKQEIIDFLIDIAVNEFNHPHWHSYLQNKDFTPYLSDDSKFLLVIKDEEIIGTLGALKINENIIKLNSFYIKKEYRKQGIGNKLFTLLLFFCKERGYDEVILCTYDEYEDAEKFYKKRNFNLYKTDGDEKWLSKKI